MPPEPHRAQKQPKTMRLWIAIAAIVAAFASAPPPD
jgi:hypothetical protein